MTSYFSGFVDFVGAHPRYALTAVFLLALSEAIPVIGTVVPGSTLIVGISALAAGANVNPWLLLVAATVGAIAGDGSGGALYGLGGVQFFGAVNAGNAAQNFGAVACGTWRKAFSPSSS